MSSSVWPYATLCIGLRAFMIPPCAANVISLGPPNSAEPLAIVFGLIAPVVGVGIIPVGLNAPANLDAGLTPGATGCAAVSTAPVSGAGVG